MRVTVTDNLNAEEWDAIALAVDGGYFHCHAQAVYDMACGGAEPIIVRAQDDGGRWMGITNGSIVPSRFWPFSAHCNWATLYCLPATPDHSGATEFTIMRELEGNLKRKGVFSLRVLSYDSPHSQQVLSALGYALTLRSEFSIDLTQNLEVIWSRFAGERRTDVRKAEKLGVVTRLENTREAFDLVFAFYAQSMQRHKVAVAAPNERAMDAQRRQLESGHGDVLVTYRNGQPVNAAAFRRLQPKTLLSDQRRLGGRVQVLWPRAPPVDRHSALQRPRSDMPEPGGCGREPDGRPQIQTGLRSDGGPGADRRETNLQDRFVPARDSVADSALTERSPRLPGREGRRGRILRRQTRQGFCFADRPRVLVESAR